MWTFIAQTRKRWFRVKDKKACSPGDTKISEAKVLTELRQELANISSSLGYSEEINKGQDDDESLEIMLSRINIILKGEGLAEIAVVESKAKTVAAINNKIDELRKQIK